jgi:hypothetical protein
VSPVPSYGRARLRSMRTRRPAVIWGSCARTAGFGEAGEAGGLGGAGALGVMAAASVVSALPTAPAERPRPLAISPGVCGPGRAASHSATWRRSWPLPSRPAGAAKNRRWAKNRYFGRYNKARNDTWVSGDPKGQRRKALPLAPSAERAIRAQHGRCPLCGEPLLYADQPPDSPGQWETWFRVIRTAITRQVITVQTADDRTGDQPRLMHTACYAATQTAQPGRHAESRACPPMRAASARCRDEWHAGL